jgi:hypothetical protein
VSLLRMVWCTAHTTGDGRRQPALRPSGHPSPVLHALPASRWLRYSPKVADALPGSARALFLERSRLIRVIRVIRGRAGRNALSTHAAFALHAFQVRPNGAAGPMSARPGCQVTQVTRQGCGREARAADTVAGGPAPQRCAPDRRGRHVTSRHVTSRHVASRHVADAWVRVLRR